MNVVQKLLHHSGVDVNQATRSGVTPLTFSCFQGYVEIVSQLLESKEIDVNKRGRDGVSPLNWAASLGHYQIVEMLLKKDGIDLNELGNNRLSPLCQASRRGDLKIVKLLLNTPGILTTSNKENGQSPLFLAATGGYVEVTTELLLSNTEYNLTEISAVIRNTPEAFETLCKSNTETEEGRSVDAADYYIRYNFQAAGFCREDASIGHILALLIKYRRTSLLHDPLIDMVFNLKWRVLQFFYYLNLIAYCIFLGLLTTFSFRLQEDPTTLDHSIVIPLLILCCIRGGVHIIQWLNSLKFLHKDPHIICETLVFVCTFSAVFFPGDLQTRLDIISFTLLVGWIAFFLLLRHVQFLDLGLFVLMSTHVAQTFLKVLILFVSLVIGFTLAFQVLVRSPNLPFGHVLFSLVMMVLGQLDFLDTFFYSTSRFGQALSFLFLMALPLLAVNFLIGLAVGDIDKIRTFAEIEKLTLMTGFIQSFDCLPFVERLFWKYYSVSVLFPNKPWYRSEVIGKFGKSTTIESSLVNLGFSKIRIPQPPKHGKKKIPLNTISYEDLQLFKNQLKEEIRSEFAQELQLFKKELLKDLLMLKQNVNE